MSNTELIKKLRRLSESHKVSPKTMAYSPIFEEAADALVAADLELQEARELGEDIISLAQTAKRILA